MPQRMLAALDVFRALNATAVVLAVVAEIIRAYLRLRAKDGE